MLINPTALQLHQGSLGIFRGDAQHASHPGASGSPGDIWGGPKSWGYPKMEGLQWKILLK